MKNILILLIVSFQAFGITLLQEKNGTYKLLKKEVLIKEILEDYTRIKKLNIIYSAEVEGKVYLYGTKEVAKKDLDLYISAVINEAGYTILANEELNQIEIIDTRDIRYRAAPLFTDISKVPVTYNHYRYLIRLKYAAANDVSRSMRPFISRYGRIIDERNANTIIISDTGKNIHRVHKIISQLDTKDYLNDIALVDEINEKHKKLIVKKESIITFIANKHILFLITFLLIGIIIGFGVNSHLNRKKMEW